MTPNPSLEPTRYGSQRLAAPGAVGIMLPRPSVVCLRAQTERAQSSFAHTVIKLRERTGRLDAALAAHAPRCDSSWVGLYTLGDEAQGFPRGIVRFFNVGNAPPRRGRPRVETTMSLAEMVQAVVGAATFTSNVEYAEPESD